MHTWVLWEEYRLILEVASSSRLTRYRVFSRRALGLNQSDCARCGPDDIIFLG